MKKISKIILIDDDEQINFLNKVVAKRSGLVEEVVDFIQARDALSYLSERSNDQPPLVLLDINMPVMNGWDFIAEYEGMGNKNALIYMLTSSINPNDEERARSSSSVKGFLSKPLTEKMLAGLADSYDKPRDH